MADIPKDDVPFEVRSLAHLASMEIGEWVVDRSRKHPRDIVAAAILADRLTRQDPETIRQAALEEAAKVAERWLESSWKDEVFAARTIADSIRALKEAGHG